MTKLRNFSFLKHLKERGLKGVRLIISDACMGLSESAAEFFPEAAWQRCIVGSLKKRPISGMPARSGNHEGVCRGRSSKGEVQGEQRLAA